MAHGVCQDPSTLPQTCGRYVVYVLVHLTSMSKSGCVFASSDTVGDVCQVAGHMGAPVRFAEGFLVVDAATRLPGHGDWICDEV
jgi:hypothetical protein